MVQTVELLAGILAGALALVHILGERLRFLRAVPRSRWLSAAGGVSVAYVFIHLLPELNRAQEAVQGLFGGGILSEQHVYLLALAGLVLFYSLERVARLSRRAEADDVDAPGAGVFWLHIVSYGVYNALIGYLLLHRNGVDVQGMLLFAFAMGVHFLVNDHGLREHHQGDYDRIGRWLLAGAVLLGWAAGALVMLPEGMVGALLAFIAGGVVLNVLKEELPEERKSRLWAFVIGAAAYSALLLVTT